MVNRLKKGDMVGRISYNKDVIFQITDIKKINRNKVYILKGITERIEADSFENDLVLIDKRYVKNKIEAEENKILKRLEKYLSYDEERYSFKNIEEIKSLGKQIVAGKILHLDGDRKYSEKSSKYYRNLGLSAIVKNIPENTQPKIITNLLDKYNPDILIITGHDGMIKKQKNYNDIYNYRNSRYFVSTVNEARKWSNYNKKDLAIFAGACQSFYEAIMSAGANFASSPKRIMIDFMDPLIVAERIALTDKSKFLSIKDIEDELRDGRDGVNGVGSMGKKGTKDFL